MPILGWIFLGGAIAFTLFYFVRRTKKKRAEDKAPAKNSPILTTEGEKLDLSDYPKYRYFTPKGAEFWSHKEVPEGPELAWQYKRIDEGLDRHFTAVRSGYMRTSDGDKPYDERLLRHDFFSTANKKVILLVDEIHYAPSGTPGLKVLGGWTGHTEILTAGTVLGGPQPIGAESSPFGNWHPFRLACIAHMTLAEHGKWADAHSEAVWSEAGDHANGADLDHLYHWIRSQSEIHHFWPKAQSFTVESEMERSDVCCLVQGGSLPSKVMLPEGE